MAFLSYKITLWQQPHGGMSGWERERLAQSSDDQPHSWAGTSNAGFQSSTDHNYYSILALPALNEWNTQLDCPRTYQEAKACTFHWWPVESDTWYRIRPSHPIFLPAYCIKDKNSMECKNGKFTYFPELLSLFIVQLHKPCAHPSSCKPAAIWRTCFVNQFFQNRELWFNLISVY